MSYMKLRLSEIEEEITVCPYCMDDWSEDKSSYGCCGECHSETAYVTNDGECYLESDVEVTDDSDDILKQKEENLKLDLAKEDKE